MTYQWVTDKSPTAKGRLLDDDLDELLGLRQPKKEAAPKSGSERKLGKDEVSLAYRNRKQNATGVVDDLDKLLGLATPSTLDRLIAVTRFPNEKAQRKADIRLSLRGLAEKIKATRADSKAELPFFKAARFGEHRTDKNSLRSNANVLAVTGLEADYDAGQIAPDEAETRLREHGIAGLVYTTPSHTPEAPRWRVITPFSEEHAPEERTRFMERLNGIFDGNLASESFTLSQSYYGGNVSGKPPIETRLIEGRCIDRADDLDATALPKRSKRTEDGEAVPGGKVDHDALTEAILSGENYHTSLYTLAASMFGKGEDAIAVSRRLYAVMDSIPEANRKPRWKAARGEIKSMIASLIEREAVKPERSEIDFDNIDDLDAEDAKPARKSRLAFRSSEDDDDTPAREYLIKGFLARGDVACIFGEPGAGKSVIAPYLAHCVAQGEEAFGQRVRQGGVFYVAAEDQHGMRGRMKALRLAHGAAPGFKRVDGVSDLLAPKSPDLDELMAAVAEHKPALIAIDTVSMAFPGLEENSAEGMGRVVAVARKLTKHGAAVLLIHHDTKERTGTPRGHSVLNGALDVAMEVRKADEHGVVRGRLTKNRNGACDRNINFKIGVAVVGVDEDGDDVTAPICEPLPADTAPMRAETLPQNEAAALKSLEIECGTAGHAPMSRWRKALSACATFLAIEGAEARRKAIQRAIKSLIKRKRIDILDDGTVFPGARCAEQQFDDLDAKRRTIDDDDI
jgi:hypothetical protein